MKPRSANVPKIRHVKTDWFVMKTGAFTVTMTAMKALIAQTTDFAMKIAQVMIVVKGFIVPTTVLAMSLMAAAKVKKRNATSTFAQMDHAPKLFTTRRLVGKISLMHT